jgi:small subunit ribosomal protein S16
LLVIDRYIEIQEGTYSVVKLKLKRMGAKHKPTYRIVVMNSTKAPNGDYLDLIGTYYPQEVDDAKKVNINEEKALSWLSKGAQPTEKTLVLLKKAKVWKKYIESKNNKGVITNETVN